MESIEKFKNIEKKICSKMNKQILKIKRGYDILKYDINDNTYYNSSKILCFNGFEGSIWDLDKYMYKDISIYIRNILFNGIKMDNIIYFLDKKSLNKANFDNIKEKNIIITMLS